MQPRLTVDILVLQVESLLNVDIGVVTVKYGTKKVVWKYWSTPIFLDTYYLLA